MSEQQRFRVQLGEQEIDVTIEASAQGLAVTVGDERWPGEWLALGGGAHVLRLGQASVEVLVAPSAEGWWVAAGGYQAEARVLDARALQLAAALPRRGGAVGRAEIRAPMPGRVARVAVAEGETVARGALLLTLEAMKMENELRAPADGIVTGLAAEAGAPVERGALLLVLTPLAGDGAGGSA